MKILSAKLKLNESIDKDRFYEILIKWLKDGLPMEYSQINRHGFENIIVIKSVTQR